MSWAWSFCLLAIFPNYWFLNTDNWACTIFIGKCTKVWGVISTLESEAHKNDALGNTSNFSWFSQGWYYNSMLIQNRNLRGLWHWRDLSRHVWKVIFTKTTDGESIIKILICYILTIGYMWIICSNSLKTFVQDRMVEMYWIRDAIFRLMWCDFPVVWFPRGSCWIGGKREDLKYMESMII